MSLKPTSEVEREADDRPARYYVSKNGDVKGPFELRMVEALILSGYLPETADIRSEDASEWRKYSHGPRGFSFVRPGAETARQAMPSPMPAPRRRRSIDRIQLYGVLGGLGFLGIIAIVITISFLYSGGAAATYKRPTPAPTPRQSSSASSTPYATPSSASSYPSTPSRGAAPKAEEEPPLYRGADGRMYSVPRSVYPRLSAEKAKLDAEFAALDVQKREVDGLEDELDRDELALDNRSQRQVDAFNRKVKRLNALGSALQEALKQYNAKVDAFNAELERVGRLID